MQNADRPHEPTIARFVAGTEGLHSFSRLDGSCRSKSVAARLMPYCVILIDREVRAGCHASSSDKLDMERRR